VHKGVCVMDFVSRGLPTVFQVSLQCRHVCLGRDAYTTSRRLLQSIYTTVILKILIFKLLLLKLLLLKLLILKNYSYSNY